MINLERLFLVLEIPTNGKTVNLDSELAEEAVELLHFTTSRCGPNEELVPP